MRSTPAILAVLAVCVGSVCASGDGGLGIGISDPPDSIPTQSRGDWLPDTCSGTFYRDWFPEYTLWEHADTTHQDHGAANVDIDLLVSTTFDSCDVGFTQDDIDDLLEHFYNTGNCLDPVKFGDYKDLPLVIDYFDARGDGYDAEAPADTGHFKFLLADTMRTKHKNHLDYYVIKWGHEDSLCGDGKRAYPTIPMGYLDGQEDVPREVCPEADDRFEMPGNAVMATSPGPGTNQWKKRLVAGLFHETGHKIISKTNPPVDYMMAVYEILACAASQLTAPEATYLTVDTFYNLSLFAFNDDPEGLPYDIQYRHWSAWGRYLLRRTYDEAMEDQIVYRWLRETQGDTTGKLYNTQCSLAFTLADSDFSWLGGSGTNVGCFRMGHLFAQFATALWLDDGRLGEEYTFGDDFSPYEDLGFFREITTPGEHWERIVPPEFTVGADADSMWVHVPGEQACWSDTAHTADPDTFWCEPIRVKSWGGNWIAFRADTTYYDGDSNGNLQIRVRWPGLPADHRLWMSRIHYSAARHDLYKHSDRATTVVDPVFYAADAGSTALWVSDFGEGGTEAVVLIVSAVDTTLEPSADGSCLRADYPIELIEYNYSYMVVPTTQGGGGCPFVQVWDGASYVDDNNILAGMTGAGLEGTDLCVLGAAPAAAGGQYRFELVESEQDLSYFDRVALGIIDHLPGTEIAQSTSGELYSCSDICAPLQALVSGSSDVTAALQTRDNTTVTVGPGSYVDVVLPVGALRGASGMGLILRGSPGHKEDAPNGRVSPEPGLLDLTALCGRANAQNWVLSLPEIPDYEQQTLTVRLVSSKDYELDSVGLAHVSESPVEPVWSAPTEAEHSTDGNVASVVLADDGSRASLEPEESIALRFDALSPPVGCVRDFIFLTEGYFETAGALVGRNPSMPTAHELVGSFPNPFNPETDIAIRVAEPGTHVTLRIYDLSGRLVATLMDRHVEPGLHSLGWAGTSDGGERVSSGVYFCRMDAGGVAHQQKLMVLK